MGRLSDARIRSLKPASRDRWIGDGNGLWLRVRTTGRKVFVIRSKRGGRTRIITLGEWLSGGGGYELARARVEAARVTADRAGAATPPHAPETISALAREFYEVRIAPRYRRLRNAQTYRDKLIRELGWRKLKDIAPAHVTAVAKAYAREAPVAANRFLAFVKLCFGYAVEAGYLPANPAAALTRRIAGGDEAARDRALTDDEIRALWHAPGAHTRLLRFLLITGARIGEAQKAAWSRIDVTARRWVIPVEHSKSKRAHWIHLPDLALEVLGKPGPASALTLRSASETAVQAWLKRWCDREKIVPRFTPHDLRRTFATRLGDLGIAPHVIAKCLNHSIDVGESLGVYLRADFEPERIESLERWAAELRRIVQSKTREPTTG
jgi:integrase